MSDCCRTETPAPDTANRHRCPVNRKSYPAVNIRTLLHHLDKPWSGELKSQAYYFCDDPDCNVVYFGQDDSVITSGKLRTRVGQKSTSPQRILCYCFGASFREAERDPSIRDYVIRQTRQSLCSCDTRNPSGRCCLKDFPLPHGEDTGDNN